MESLFGNYGVIIAIVLVIFFAGGFVLSFLKANKIRKEGIATDAVISKIIYDSDDDGATTEVPYVIYKDLDGIQRESKAALNSAIKHHEGEKVRVKYLPGDYKFVVESKD